MIGFCHDAQAVLGDRDAAQVAESLLVSLALSRALELIGEAASRLPAELRQQHRDVPWRTAINFRNVLVHGYDTLDYAIAVDVVRIDIPTLIDQLETILHDLDASP